MKNTTIKDKIASSKGRPTTHEVRYRDSGRPTKVTPEVLAILEDAFLIGHTDTEACLIANIDPATLYRYCKENPDFARRKEELKENQFAIARRTLMKGVKENPELALKFLERKKKAEFGVKTEVDLTTGGKPITGFNYVLPSQVIEGEIADESNTETNAETTPSISDSTGQTN
jgi:hypothetical protein